ncbi:MAG: hypothetical protein PHE32_03200 [Candidatus Shapirobacteria bacterium]|nr:hypothetical protein [Candidatus Shapirobacteria bacterium]MDD4410679.1 hypothetical protein [Candidatus Shapirobacteria bacterium]
MEMWLIVFIAIAVIISFIFVFVLALCKISGEASRKEESMAEKKR